MSTAVYFGREGTRLLGKKSGCPLRWGVHWFRRVREINIITFQDYWMGLKNLHRTHHFVIFMLQHVTMPHISPGERSKTGNNGCNVTKGGSNRIF